VVSIVRKRKNSGRMAKVAASRRQNTKPGKNAAFGRTLYALRVEKKYSQEELSFRCEIDRSYLGQLERGEKEPCLAMLIKLSVGLETPLTEIFRRFELDDGDRKPLTKRNPRVR